MTGKPAGKVAEIMDGATGMGETADTSLGRFLLLLEEALTRFVNGEPALLKQIASRREDATIMGAWGAYERGWHEVGHATSGLRPAWRRAGPGSRSSTFPP